MDQAQRLREILESPDLKKTNENDARIITVTSGKGGVGKTNFTVNLAWALASQDKRVSIVDADLGLANVDVVLGIMPKLNLGHVIRNEATIQDIITTTENGLNIISGGSGSMDLVDLDDKGVEKIIESFAYLNKISDYILIDTGAGLSNAVLSFIEAAHDTIVVINPDPASMTDAYALIKNIRNVEYNELNVVVNRVDNAAEGESVYSKLNAATEKFLGKNLIYLGCIHDDYMLKRAVRRQIPIMDFAPNAVSSKGIYHISYSLINEKEPEGNVRSFKSFISKLIKRQN